MNDETEKAIRDSFYSGYRSGYRAGKQEEYKKYSAKLNKIVAGYHKELEAAWNRWEDSDGKMERRMASDKWSKISQDPLMASTSYKEKTEDMEAIS